MMTRSIGVMAVAVALVATASSAQTSRVNPRLLPVLPGFTAIDAASIAKRARPRRGRDVISDVTIDELRAARCVVIANMIVGNNVNARQTFDVRRFTVNCD